MWEAEADTELTQSASLTTVVGQKALALAKWRYSTVVLFDNLTIETIVHHSNTDIVCLAFCNNEKSASLILPDVGYDVVWWEEGCQSCDDAPVCLVAFQIARPLVRAAVVHSQDQLVVGGVGEELRQRRQGLKQGRGIVNHFSCDLKEGREKKKSVSVITDNDSRLAFCLLSRRVLHQC